MNELILSERMPVLALRGLVVFPQATMHFDVGREKSIRALESAMSADQRIFLVTQRDIVKDDPTFADLYSVGTVAHVRQVLKMPGDSIRILVRGEYRAHVAQMHQTAPFFAARVESLPDQEYTAGTARIEALTRMSAQLFDEFAELSQRPVQETMLKILASSDPGFVADQISQAATFGFPEKMRVLEQRNPVRRLEIANKLLTRELEVLRLENDLQDKTQQSIDKGQRDYYLREQMKVIRSELGENDDEAELEEYQQKLEKCKLPEEAAAEGGEGAATTDEAALWLGRGGGDSELSGRGL